MSVFEILSIISAAITIVGAVIKTVHIIYKIGYRKGYEQRTKLDKRTKK